MSPMPAGQLAEQSRSLYERAKIAAYYASDTAITLGESVVLQRCRADYVLKHVLDLGVGAGRTTAWLAPNSASYVGLDYSRTMVRSPLIAPSNTPGATKPSSVKAAMKVEVFQ